VVSLSATRGAVSQAKDAMGVRDFLVECVQSATRKVGTGAIRAVAGGGQGEWARGGVVPPLLSLTPARVLIGAAGEDSMWERLALYAVVLPALQRRMRRNHLDLSWLDWHHVAAVGTRHSPNCPQEWSHPVA
jgi:hypothetical protein